jgi:hypothetical protein
MRRTEYRTWKTDQLVIWFKEGVGEVSWHVVDECVRRAGLVYSSEERHRNENIAAAYISFLTVQITHLQVIAQAKPITAKFMSEYNSVRPQLPSIAAVLKEWAKLSC